VEDVPDDSEDDHDHLHRVLETRVVSVSTAVSVNMETAMMMIVEKIGTAKEATEDLATEKHVEETVADMEGSDGLAVVETEETEEVVTEEVTEAIGMEAIVGIEANELNAEIGVIAEIVAIGVIVGIAVIVEIVVSVATVEEAIAAREATEVVAREKEEVWTMECRNLLRRLLRYRYNRKHNSNNDKTTYITA